MTPRGSGDQKNVVVILERTGSQRGTAAWGTSPALPRRLARARRPWRHQWGYLTQRPQRQVDAMEYGSGDDQGGHRHKRRRRPPRRLNQGDSQASCGLGVPEEAVEPPMENVHTVRAEGRQAHPRSTLMGSSQARTVRTRSSRTPPRAVLLVDGHLVGRRAPPPDLEHPGRAGTSLSTPRSMSPRPGGSEPQEFRAVVRVRPAADADSWVRGEVRWVFTPRQDSQARISAPPCDW